MEDKEVVRLIGQYLHERGYLETLLALGKDSGRVFSADTMIKKTGELQSILDDHSIQEKRRQEATSKVDCLFEHGLDEYVNQLWCSFDCLSDGANVLVVRLVENGVLLFGAAKAQLGVAQLPSPLPTHTPPIAPIPTIYSISKGSILTIDVHPKKRNLILCGSMDRLALLLDLNQPDDTVLQTFHDHKKYVVCTLWSPSGNYFITGSYDKSVCVYSTVDDSETFELAQQLPFRGAVEGLAFTKGSDEFVVGIRNDYNLHCYKITSGSVDVIRLINMNAFGDDYVSFVPMYITFSPDGRFILVSTDRDRLVLFSWESGKQITNFYGATNDEYSQPRNCWDPSGKYIYGTSQDETICVWEIRSQTIVSRLTGHSGIVRDLYFCKEFGLLISCGFDGSVKLWRQDRNL